MVAGGGGGLYLENSSLGCSSTGGRSEENVGEQSPNWFVERRGHMLIFLGNRLTRRKERYHEKC